MLRSMEDRLVVTAGSPIGAAIVSRSHVGQKAFARVDAIDDGVELE